MCLELKHLQDRFVEADDTGRCGSAECGSTPAVRFPRIPATPPEAPATMSREGAAIAEELYGQ